jgi:hypothetical protein
MSGTRMIFNAEMVTAGMVDVAEIEPVAADRRGKGLPGSLCLHARKSVA